ncbi:hypothetical protein LARV_01008 [Longilinea arvoryzae]|uniref:Uncharacterized protein n=1 Tax=Longilinea arvoryzae TaxID=360412 RepID=A0A0S7BD78_9CHLR|nr:hypothetical protein LARV_01008 [Longilinea arvoryzae]
MHVWQKNWGKSSVSANDPKTEVPIEALDPATQEKIREFCYELALALRRITGRVVEDAELDLPEDLGSSEQAKKDSQEK